MVTEYGKGQYITLVIHGVKYFSQISQEHEEEIRRLVAVVEIKIKRAIFPQKPVAVSHYGHITSI